MTLSKGRPDDSEWRRITDWSFNSEEEIVPKFTYLLDEGKIKWKVFPYVDKQGKVKHALFRTPWERIST